MRALARLVAGLVALMRGQRANQELDEELRAYLDAAIDEKMRDGMPREAATRAARVEMGSVEAVKDRTRDAGWETGLENLWRDVRYAARTLRRSPGFSTVAVLTLALGIGANTAIFSAVNAIMLRPLPVERPDELVSMVALYPRGADPFSYAAYRQFATEAADVVDVFAASSARRDALTVDGPPEPVDLKWVSGNYFSTLGVQPAVGRALLPSDDRLPSGEPVAVVSDSYWTRRFGRDPSAVGRAVQVRGVPFTIVGVAPRGFFGETVGEAPDVWLPLTAQPGAPPHLWNGHSITWLRLMARRRPGVPFAGAHTALELVYGRVRDEIAGGLEDAEFRRNVLQSRVVVSEARGGWSTLRGPLGTPLLILMGIVGLVLVIACANVANLMLARAATRRRETAVCLAIGAGRLRLVRQGLAEALLLAAAGGAGGLLLASWGTTMLMTLVSRTWPVAIDLSPDARVLGFTAVVSSATAVLFGLVPALRAGRVDPLPALRVGGGRGRGNARRALGRTLVVTQIAVSLVLLVSAGLFVRSLLKLEAIDPGFDPDRVLLFQIAPSAGESVPRDEMDSLYRRLFARAESVPGVQAASGAFVGLFGAGSWGNSVTVEGFEPPPGVTPRTFANAVAPRYLDVMRITMVRGRGFTDDDHANAPKVALVNQMFARQFFGEANPIGKRVGLGWPAKEMMEVVGITADVKYGSLREEARPMLYVPFTQSGHNLHEIGVRTVVAPGAAAAMLHRELAAVDSRLAIVRMAELRDLIDASIVAERLVARLSATFGLLAMMLAGIGLYGVVAYLTAGRTGEIGVRMALGAGRRDVRWLVMRDTLVLLAVGLAVGLSAALAGTRLLSAQLYAVTPHDAVAFSASVVSLSLVALLAGYIPARRAARVDPVLALRAE